MIIAEASIISGEHLLIHIVSKIVKSCDYVVARKCKSSVNVAQVHSFHVYCKKVHHELGVSILGQHFSKLGPQTFQSDLQNHIFPFPSAHPPFFLEMLFWGQISLLNYF